MAVAAHTGVDGNVTFAGGAVSGEIFRWSADFQRDIHDVTTFAAATNVRKKLGGMLHATGTFEAWFDGTTPALTDFLDTNELGATLQLDVETTPATKGRYAFLAILSNVAITTEKTGMVAITATFESSGTITVTESGA